MLKDKKNLAIIAIVAAVIVILAVAFVFLQPTLFGGAKTQAPPSTPPPAAAPANPNPPAQAPGPGQSAQSVQANKAAVPAAKPTPAAAPGAAKPLKSAKAGALGSKTEVANMPPNARPDPFVIPGSAARRVAPPPPVSSFVPSIVVTNWRPRPVVLPRPKFVGLGTRVASLPGDRVAGIMMNNGVYAIVDSNGQSQVVQPGDTLPGGERVVSIQSSSVTFRTLDNQTVDIPLSAGNPAPPTTTAAPGVPAVGGSPINNPPSTEGPS